ncbi:MAG: glycine cleavage system protein GcvH [Candidatus Helarchaeota archaeon]
MSNIPDGLKYIEQHQWAKVDGDIAIIGVTDYAQAELKEIVLVDFLVGEGDSVTKQGDPFGSIESTKAVSDVFSPVSGEVTAINSAVEEEPELVNKDPYGDGWLIKVKMSDKSELDGLMDAAAYKAFIEK